MSEKNKTRQSPYSLSAEKAVLGCLLIDKEAIYKTVHSLSINAFYDEAHKTIFKAICEMFENGKTVDSITICLLYTSPSPRDRSVSRMPSSA